MSRRGFALIEAVFAFALVGFMLVVTLNLLPSSVVAVRKGEERLQAENLARSFLEQARGASFGSLAPGTTDLESPLPQFIVQQEVYPVDGADPDQLLGVRITVSWTARGRPQELVREVWVSRVRS